VSLHHRPLLTLLTESSALPAEPLLSSDDDKSWQEWALCAETDPEAFFPEKGESTRAAKRICGDCPVKAHCLEFSLVNEERFGVWGGLSERERRRLRTSRRAVAQQREDEQAA